MKKIQYLGNKNIISNIIKEYRIKNNLTQNELSAKMQTLGVNMDQQMLSKIEKNERIVTDYEMMCFCVILKLDLESVYQQFQNTIGEYNE